MFTGQMACEGVNWGLKRWIKEERPRGMHSRPPSALPRPFTLDIWDIVCWWAD
jgi:hypothetical protein